MLSASGKDRRDLFVSTGGRIGTVEQNIEKDFWVCWTLDVLFNGLQPGGPRLLFKGGTSLSKGFGLIERFSEDIDITVFREDIGEPATVEELESISGKKRAARLDAIRAACRDLLTTRYGNRLRYCSTELSKSRIWWLEAGALKAILKIPTNKVYCYGIPALLQRVPAISDGL